MSWSVTAFGTREQVHAAIDEQVNPDLASGDQVLEFERANRSLHSLLESLRSADQYQVSAHGSYDSCSIDMSATYNPRPATDA